MLVKTFQKTYLIASPERIIIPNYFENAAHSVTDSDRGKQQQQQQHVRGRELAPLKADEAVMPRLDFFCHR